MNARDKELWEKAQQWDSSDDGRGKLKILESVEKFAELIVRECAKAAGDFEYARLHDSLVEDHILKHFGVEE